MGYSPLHRILICCFLVTAISASAQTTFTESAASYGLNISGSKDGGHAWSDYDDDGDLDVLVLENQNGSTRSYLMRNNGNNTFTDVRAALVPGMGNDPAERQAAWGDLNNDGRPDFMITSHGNNGGSNRAALQIYLQNAGGTFGDGIGGNNPITVGRSGYTINISPLNAEGAGFFDFEGDGDLDIFFDSHNYGIELLRNNYIDHTSHTVVNPPVASMFTHITTANGSPNVQFGLNQFATDGDFGSAADVNDDGWVDIFMRKRDENDFFLNQGGTFTSGADLAQANNSNKGGNGLWDLDNDGDLDAVWTENDITQIFRNDGPGIWVALGAGTFPGLPQPPNNTGSSSSAIIDALAGGDIDNDGDIDILLVGNSRSYLYINQLNSPSPAPGTVGSGTAMTFALDTTESFNSGANGEGTTMADVDDDGDLDIYMSINGTNRLYINNLPAANRNNHLLIDVTEDRDADGSTGGFAGRTAIGTNVLIRDCDGNIVSGLRQVNGVFGHGTQQPEEVHFGLPLGENQTYLIEVHYPNFYDPVDGFTRLIATGIAQPSTIAGTNHYVLTTTDAESLQNDNAPVANDDLETVSFGNSVSVQISLFDNDSEPDGENFFIESVVQPAIGSVVIDDADTGLVTYTYSAGTPFPGTTFDYTISDAQVTLCPSAGLTDTATVTIYEPCADSGGIDYDGDGINDICDYVDDNDGILDSAESPISILWVTNGTPGSEEQNTIDKLIGLGYSVTVVDDNVGGNANNYDVTFIFEDVFSGDAFANVANLTTTTNGVVTSEPALHDEILGAASGGASTTSFVNIVDNTHFITTGLSLGNYDIGDAEYYGSSLTTGTELGRHPNGEGSIVIWESGDAMETGTAPGRRTIVPHTNNNGGFNSAGEDLLVKAILWTARNDTDGDSVDDYLDLDSDNDGIYDVVEAGHDVVHTAGRLTGAVGLDGVADAIQNSGQEDSGTVNYTVRDSDSDGNNDFVELDSDADGCEDVLEAGFTESVSATGELLGTGYDSTTGLVTGNGDGYSTPADGDANSFFDYREAGTSPAFTVQPSDTIICPGCTGSFSVTATNLDTYQWQLFNGSSWVDLTDTGIHGGTVTSTLTITNPTTAENGNQYRVVVSNSSYNCALVTSNTAILIVAVNSVITNRRITYRVNRN
ncbi:MAG: hypothetical protein Salg2KO_06380 [Salibacteraceae bacterium]